MKFDDKTGTPSGAPAYLERSFSRGIVPSDYVTADSTEQLAISGIPHWDESPETWERVIIRGMTFPGTATVTGDGYKRKTDKKSAPGENGEVTTDLGQEAADIDITVELWTVEHLATFQFLVREVLRPPAKFREEIVEELFTFATGREGTQGYYVTKTEMRSVDNSRDAPGPVDIFHPALALFGINKVQVLAIGLPTAKTKDIWQSRIRCRQFIAGRKGRVTTKEKSEQQGLAQALGGNALQPGGGVQGTPTADALEANAPSNTITGPTYVARGTDVPAIFMP